MNDNSTVKNFAPPITDLRCDPCSGVVDIIIKDEKGFYIAQARPPRSIADYQNKVQGWNPEIFFDETNETKHVRGISKPLPDGHHIVRGNLATQLRVELVKFKNQIPTQVINPKL